MTKPTCDFAGQVALVTGARSGMGLDMAHNNSGIQVPPTDAADELAEQYDRKQRRMRAQGGGAIVNCPSIGGLIGLPGRAAYHASKHGAIGLRRGAVLEHGPRGMRIDAICPGACGTPMAAKMSKEEPKEMVEIMKSQPIGRLGESGEVAGAVLWLCGDASSFVFGVALPVDGGYVAH